MKLAKQIGILLFCADPSEEQKQYAIYRVDNENENIQILIDWLLSEEGQQLIEASGYVTMK